MTVFPNHFSVDLTHFFLEPLKTVFLLCVYLHFLIATNVALKVLEPGCLIYFEK